MFNKLKQVKDLRSQAKTLQNALADETISLEKNGISITLNGNMEITNISIAEEQSNDKLENNLKITINDALKKAQRLMAEKMQSMGGLPNFQ